MKVGDQFAGLPDEQGHRVVRVLAVHTDLFVVRIEEAERWPWTVGEKRTIYRSVLQNRYTPIDSRGTKIRDTESHVSTTEEPNRG